MSKKQKFHEVTLTWPNGMSLVIIDRKPSKKKGKK